MTSGDFEPPPGQYRQPGPYGQPGRYPQPGPYGQPGGYPRHPAVCDRADWACGSSPA